MKSKVTGLITVAAVLSAGAAMAGTITLANNGSGTPGPTQIASELVRGATTDLTVNIGARIASYTPTDITLPGGLIDPQVHGTLITLQLDDAAAKFTATTPANLTVCDITTPAAPVLVAGYVAGNNTNVISFNGTTATAPIVNTNKYAIAGPGCAPLAANGLQVLIPKTDKSQGIGFTWSTYATVVNPTVPQDKATAALIAVKPGLTASITQKLDATIDSTNSFLTFLGGVRTDTLDVTTTLANLEVPLVVGAGDKLTVTVKPSAPGGLFTAAGGFPAGATATMTTPGVVGATPCTAANNVITCTNTATDATYATLAGAVSTIAITTPGNVAITPKSFTATVEATFAAAGEAADTGANALLTDADAGRWMVNGFTGVIPYLYTATNPDYSSYCLVNNGGPLTSTVFVSPVTTEGAAAVTSVGSLQIGDVAAGKSRLLVFKGDNIYFSDAVTNTNQLTPLTGGAAIHMSAGILATGKPTDITVTCLQNDPAGNKRVIPVLVNGQQAVGADNYKIW